MQALKIISYICFGFAALGLLLAAATEELVFVISAITMLVTGVLIIALNKIITTLVEIRDALLGESNLGARENANVGTHDDVGVYDAQEARPQRSIQEISADLDRMKKKLV